MILDGLSITVIGMVIVFVFLVLLVAAMKGLHLALKKAFPKSLVEKPLDETDEVSGAAVRENKLAVVAAAVAAIKDHVTAGGG